MKRRTFKEGIKTSITYRVFWSVMTILFAGAVLEGLTDDPPSVVSVVIRSAGLVLCLTVLYLSATKKNGGKRGT